SFGTETPVKIKMPETLNVGNNVFTVSGVKNPDDYVIKIKDFETGAVYDGEKGIFNINFEEPGEHKFTALLYKDHILTCVSLPVKAEVKDLLSVFTVYPYYRDIVQSKDPEKVLRLKVGIGNTDKENLKLVWKLISDKVLYEETFEGRENREIIYDISSLAYGKYKYNVSLYEGDNLLREYEREFKVLEPSDYEVTFDRKRICYINGEPFFPIFLYHSGEWMMNYLNQNKKSEAPVLEIKSMLKDIADHGFNGAITQGPFPMPENYAVNTREAGMEISFEIGGNTDKEVLEKARDTYNLYNDGLFYYTVDEPIGDRLKTAITEYSMLKEIDPHRPVGAAVCHGAVFGEANNAFDIMMPDNYIIRNNNKEGRPSFRGLLAFIESAMEPNGWRKPLWAVPQAFGWNGDNVAFGVPTRDELRCQMYFYLVYGATGFAWYGYTSPERDETTPYNLWHLPSSDLWDYFNVLNGEMKDFSQIIIKGGVWEL
ncbi:MAG: hypothetical protein KBT47_02580, partial [Armatimonadetes bacterium]|nr:hypothetical protein [Candidatus Hippobium faecium]